MPRAFDEVMIVNPYDAGSPWKGETRMRFYRSSPPGYGSYVAPGYGYHPGTPGYGYYAAPAGYPAPYPATYGAPADAVDLGYYGAPLGYGPQPPDPNDYGCYAAPAGYSPGEPGEYYGVPAGYAAYSAAPSGYAQAAPPGYAYAAEEQPDALGYYQGDPAWGQAPPEGAPPDMAGYYADGGEWNAYQGYGNDGGRGDEGMSGYVRSQRPRYNPGCLLPTNVGGYPEEPGVSGYTSPSTVNANCTQFSPQPPTDTSDVFRPLF